MEERYISIAICVVIIWLAVSAWRLRRRRVTPGAAAGAMMDQLLNQDRRAAIEIIVQERASYRDPEDRDGHLPELGGDVCRAEQAGDLPSRREWGIGDSLSGAPRSNEAVRGDRRDAQGQRRRALGIRALVAVGSCIVAEIQRQRLAALSGVVVGWTVLLCAVSLATWTAIAIGGSSVHAASWEGIHYAVMFTIGCGYGALSGWVVGRLHRTKRVAAVFGFLASVLFAGVAALPLYYWLNPSLFFSTVLPHLPFFLTANLVGAPAGIVGAGIGRSLGGAVSGGLTLRAPGGTR